MGKRREYKTIPALVETLDEDQGIVTHLVALHGELDLGGDISHNGSFSKTLAERKDDIRVLDSHNRHSALAAIGVPLNIWETAREGLPQKVLEKFPNATGGVMAETQFLMGTPEGRGIFERIRQKAITQFSYSYDALDSDYEKKRIGEKIVRVRNLRTVKLYEYGPVVFGMNPGALVTGAKEEGLDDEPPWEASKPEPEETENTVRIRVKNPSGFQKGSFRTIKITSGVQAVIGKLQGETSTTVQSYIFDKNKWTLERAQKWVSEHKPKALSLAERMDSVLEAFGSAHAEDLLDVRLVKEDHLIVADLLDEKRFYMIGVEEGKIQPREDWVVGDLVFVENQNKRKERNAEILRKISIERGLVQVALAQESK